jgi:hypothetical protein
MGTSLQEPPAMAAKKKGVSVQIDEDVVKTARLVSALTEQPMAALVSEILRPALAKMEQEEMAKRSQETHQTPKRKTGGK